jgi:histone deacetylase complex regulatory component SIN3
VNLFVQDYINTATLLKESRNFLGDSELMRQFKEILGWDEKKEKEAWMHEQQQKGLTRPSLGNVLDRRSRADMNVQYGSYRRLPGNVSFFSVCYALFVIRNHAFRRKSTYLAQVVMRCADLF